MGFASFLASSSALSCEKEIIVIVKDSRHARIYFMLESYV
jgi:hypothetical protein